MIRRRLSGALAAVLLTALPALAAGPIIDVEKDADRRIAAGVDRYADISTAEVGTPAGDVLAFDLELSGWFQAIRPGMLPPRSLNDWQRLGAEVVLEVSVEAGTISGAVRDVGTGTLLFEKRYASRRGSDKLRDRLHAFADDVVLNAHRGARPGPDQAPLRVESRGRQADRPDGHRRVRPPGGHRARRPWRWAPGGRPTGSAPRTRPTRAGTRTSTSTTWWWGRATRWPATRGSMRTATCRRTGAPSCAHPLLGRGPGYLFKGPGLG